MPTTGDDAAAGASHSFQREAATVALLAVLAPSSFVQAAQAPSAAAPKAARKGLRNRGNRDGGGGRSKKSKKARVGGSDQKEEEEEEEEERVAEVSGADGTADVAATNEIDEGVETDTTKAEEEGIAKEAEEEGEGKEEGEGEAQEAAAATTTPKIADFSGEESSSVRQDKKRRQIKHHQGGVDGSGDEEGEQEQGGVSSGGREAGPTEGSPHDIGSAGAGRGGGSGAGAAAAGGALTEFRATEEVGEEGAEHRADDEDCRVTGPCLWCEKDELDLEYCRETRRRQEVRCPVALTGLNAGSVGVGGGGVGVLPSSVQYRPCSYAVEDDFQGLFHFWLAMVVVGSLACFGMRRRQQKGGSLYDRRAK